MTNAIPSASYHYAPATRFEFNPHTIHEITKPDYQTHRSHWSQRLHHLSETILLCSRLCLQYGARFLYPNAGEYKKYFLWNLAERVKSITSFLLLIIPSLPSAPFGMLLRSLEHRNRPAISLLFNKHIIQKKYNKDPELTISNPLHIRTHNLGLVPTFFSTLIDLRDPIARAWEIAFSITSDLQHQPDIICFQEAIHEDATKILCNELSKVYPFIAHSIAPQIEGFNSGSLIVSKYKIQSIVFETFKGMMGVENICPRGITRIGIKTKSQRDLYIYNVHTVAMSGIKRSAARYKQINQLLKFLKKDKVENQSCYQLCVGDFNISLISEKGENNEYGTEKKVLDLFNKNFDDLFLKNHDFLGKRLPNTKSCFLYNDNRRLNRHELPEPKGSWHTAEPFFEKTKLSNLLEFIEDGEYKSNHKKCLKQLSVNTWGTEQWKEQHSAETSRPDYICILKNDRSIDGIAEIRRSIVPPNVHSASSDHAPVDGLIWIKL